jgi:phosphoglycerate dehydrogenase-like enzyme
MEYQSAIVDGGGVFSTIGPDATGLVWTDSQDVESLEAILEKFQQIEWIQLPFAGVDNFKSVFDSCLAGGRRVRFTSAKGAYREPVAEHALMLALALARVLPERIFANSWGRKFAATLFDSNVVIVGGGGIAEELIRLLTPFRAQITVLRRSIEPMQAVSRVTTLEDLDEVLEDADFVFVASALTKETAGLFDFARFTRMKASAYFINIARGAIVSSAGLEKALREGVIAGAGIDVTDPEPLPDGHSLWNTPNLIITPHTADTPEMCIRLLSERIVENVANLISEKPLVGQVNLKLGY